MDTLTVSRVLQEILGNTKSIIMEEIQSGIRNTDDKEEAAPEETDTMGDDQQQVPPNETTVDGSRVFPSGLNSTRTRLDQWNEQKSGIWQQINEILLHALTIEKITGNIPSVVDDEEMDDLMVFVEQMEITLEDLEDTTRHTKIPRSDPNSESTATKEYLNKLNIATQVHPWIIASLVKIVAKHIESRNCQGPPQLEQAEVDNRKKWSETASALGFELDASSWYIDHGTFGQHRETRRQYEKPDSQWLNQIMERTQFDNCTWKDNKGRTWQHYERLIWRVPRYDEIPECAKILATTFVVDLLKVIPAIYEQIIKIAAGRQWQNANANMTLLHEGMASHGQDKAHQTLAILEVVNAWLDQPVKILEQFEKTAQTHLLRILCTEMLDRMNLKMKLTNWYDRYDVVFAITTTVLRWSAMAMDFTDLKDETNKLLWAGHERHITDWKKAYDKYGWTSAQLKSKDKVEQETATPIIGIATANALTMSNHNWTGPITLTETHIVAPILPTTSVMTRARIAEEIMIQKGEVEPQGLLDKMAEYAREDPGMTIKEIAIPRTATQEDFVRIINEYKEGKQSSALRQSLNLQPTWIICKRIPNKEQLPPKEEQETEVTNNAGMYRGSQCKMLPNKEAQQLCPSLNIDLWPVAPATITYEEPSMTQAQHGSYDTRNPVNNARESITTFPNRSQNPAITALRNDGVTEINSLFGGGSFVTNGGNLFPTGWHTNLFTTVLVAPVASLEAKNRQGILAINRGKMFKDNMGAGIGDTQAMAQLHRHLQHHEFLGLTKEEINSRELIKEEIDKTPQWKALSEIIGIYRMSELAITIPALATLEDLVSRKMCTAILYCRMFLKNQKDQKMATTDETKNFNDKANKGVTAIECTFNEMHEELREALNKAMAPANAIFSPCITVPEWKIDGQEIRAELREAPANANNWEPLKQRATLLAESVNQNIKESFTIATLTSITPNELLQVKQERTQECLLHKEHKDYIVQLEKTQNEAYCTLWSISDVGKLDQATTTITDIIPDLVESDPANFTPNSGFYDEFRTNKEGHVHITARIDSSGLRLQFGICLGTKWKYISTKVLPELVRIREKTPTTSTKSVDPQQICTLAVTATIEHVQSMTVDSENKPICQHELIMELVVNGRHVKNKHMWNHKATNVMYSPMIQMLPASEYLSVRRHHHIYGGGCMGTAVTHKMMVFPALELRQSVLLNRALYTEWTVKCGDTVLAKAIPSIVQLHVQAMLCKIARQKELLINAGNFTQIQPTHTWQWDHDLSIEANIDSAFQTIMEATNAPNMKGIIVGKLKCKTLVKEATETWSRNGETTLIAKQSEPLSGWQLAREGDSFWATGKAAFTKEGLYIEIFTDQDACDNQAVKHLQAMRAGYDNQWGKAPKAKEWAAQALQDATNEQFKTHWVKYVGAEQMSLWMMVENMGGVQANPEALIPKEIWINE